MNGKRILIKLNRFLDIRHRYISNTTFVIILSVLVGILAGLAAALLKTITYRIEEHLSNLQWTDKYYLFIVTPALGIFLSVLYLRRVLGKKKFDHGLVPILETISRRGARTEAHNIHSQIMTSALTVGFGGSAGLEAPIVSSGAAIGSNIAYYLKLNYREAMLLLACGAAAGISAVFNSPIAGMVFAIEAVMAEFAVPALIPLLIASATSAVIARIFYKEQLFFLVTEGWELESLLLYILLGILLGILSYLFMVLKKKLGNYFAKFSTRRRFMTGGLMLGGLVFLFPSLYGEGYTVIKELLSGNYQVAVSNSLFGDYRHMEWLVIVFTLLIGLAKIPAAVITLNAGGNGGLFGPSLVSGGMIGFVFAYALNLTGWMQLPVSNFIVAGMAGSLSGVFRAPLTGIFLIAEITGGYMLMVPLMIVSALSFFISRYFSKFSIYTMEMAESGSLFVPGDKDTTILRMMKLRYLVEKNFYVLPFGDKLADHKSYLIHSKRNIFPVVDENRELKGIVMLEDVLTHFFEESRDEELTVQDLVQPAPGSVDIRDSMPDVMRKLDDKSIWMLPVTDQGKYVGFVSKSSIFNKYRKLMIRQSAHNY